MFVFSLESKYNKFFSTLWGLKRLKLNLLFCLHGLYWRDWFSLKVFNLMEGRDSNHKRSLRYEMK